MSPFRCAFRHIVFEIVPKKRRLHGSIVVVCQRVTLRQLRLADSNLLKGRWYDFIVAIPSLLFLIINWRVFMPAWVNINDKSNSRSPIMSVLMGMDDNQRWDLAFDGWFLNLFHLHAHLVLGLNVKVWKTPLWSAITFTLKVQKISQLGKKGIWANRSCFR